MVGRELVARGEDDHSFAAQKVDRGQYVIGRIRQEIVRSDGSIRPKADGGYGQQREERGGV
jgi:hypothetical protein